MALLQVGTCVYLLLIHATYGSPPSAGRRVGCYHPDSLTETIDRPQLMFERNYIIDAAIVTAANAAARKHWRHVKVRHQPSFPDF